MRKNFIAFLILFLVLGLVFMFFFIQGNESIEGSSSVNLSDENIESGGIVYLSADIPMNDDSKVVFNIEGEHYGKIVPGRLLEDFTQVDFHRGVKSYNTSVRSEIVENGYVGRSGNFKYNYTSNGTDYFSIKHEMTRENEGIDLIGEGYDAVSIASKVDVKGRHMFKFRFHGVNHESDRTYCDSGYYVMENKDWELYTIPLTQIENEACGLDFSRVNAVSVVVNDVENSDVSSGNISFDEFRLRKQSSYLIDNWNYQQINTEAGGWSKYSNELAGANLSVSNTGNKSGENSMEADYRYGGTQPDFVNIRRSFPYQIDIRRFNSSEISINSDKGNYHRIKMLFWNEDSSNRCDTNYKSLKKGRQNLSWSISKLSEGCEKSNISRIGYQLNDKDNSNFGKGSVFVSNVKLSGRNVTTSAKIGWVDRNESSRKVTWTARKEKKNEMIDSSESSFKVNSVQPKEQKINERSGDITNWIERSDYLERYSYGYEKPDPRDIDSMKKAVKCLDQGDLGCSSSNLSLINYEITKFDQNDKNQTYYILSHKKENKGWGYYFYNPRARNNLIISAPHSKEDINTGKVASKLFKNASAEWLLIGSADRDANLNYIAEPVELFNTQHPQFNAFKAILREEDDYLEIHGFTINKHPEYPEIIMSNGKGGRKTQLIDTHSKSLENNGFELGIYDTNTFMDLGNTYSLFGRYANSEKVEFISYELENDIRTNNSKTQKFVRSIAKNY